MLLVQIPTYYIKIGCTTIHNTTSMCQCYEFQRQDARIIFTGFYPDEGLEFLCQVRISNSLQHPIFSPQNSDNEQEMQQQTSRKKPVT